MKKAGAQKLLSDIISLVRFAVGKAEVLEPFSETGGRRFAAWIARQEKNGRRFTPDQREWLIMIKDHISSSLSVEMEDLELAPFYEKGGPVRVSLLFGPNLNSILEELNEVLAA